MRSSAKKNAELETVGSVKSEGAADSPTSVLEDEVLFYTHVGWFPIYFVFTLIFKP